MFDFRVIIAVLITLWGVGMAMANDIIDVQDIQSFSAPDFSQIQQFIPQTPFSNQEPTIPIQATVIANQSPQLDTQIKEPLDTLKVQFATNSGNIFIRGSQISFQNRQATLIAYGFTGSIQMADTMRIDGSAKELQVNNISFQDARLSSDPLTVYSFTMNGLQRKHFTFAKAKGKIETKGGKWQNMEATQSITMKSFSGNARFWRENNTYQFKGKIAQLYSKDNQLLQIGT